jgi:ABC-type multidrug transport system ATPase subunit
MIQFENASFSYDGRESIIDRADFALEPGLTLCLGPNSCGKSTLLKLAAGVEYPDSGRILIDGRDLWKEEVEARRSLAYLPEQPDLTPYATIGDIIRLVCRLRQEDPRKGSEALGRVGLESLAGRSVRELSLGQRRRALFAAVLIGQPANLLLDEPLEAMDRGIEAEIHAWIGQRVDAGATVAVVSHALEPFAEKASRAVTIVKGRISLVDRLPDAMPARLDLLRNLAKGLPAEA